jgi:hypothetical protein
MMRQGSGASPGNPNINNNYLDDGYGVKNERLYDYENVYEITD